VCQYSAGSLKQQSIVHVTPLKHIIQILSLSYFAITPKSYVFSAKEGTNTKFIVFGLTGPGPNTTIYRTRGEQAKY
jgi:hypothetical protein